MTLRRRIAGGIRVIGVLLFLGGVLAGCYEGLQWLQRGSTDPMVLQDITLERMPRGMANWVRAPQSWIGLHRVVAWTLDIPVYAVAIMAGFLVLLAAGAPRRPGT